MPALSFSDPNAPDQILSGEKRSTIRPFRSSRASQIKKAETLQLWFRQQSKDRFKIADVKRLALHPLKLQETCAMLPYNHREFIAMTPAESNQLAKRDGFQTYTDLFNWLARTYGGPKAITDQLWMCIIWQPPIPEAAS